MYRKISKIKFKPTTIDGRSATRFRLKIGWHNLTKIFNLHFWWKVGHRLVNFHNYFIHLYRLGKEEWLNFIDFINFIDSRWFTRILPIVVSPVVCLENDFHLGLGLINFFVSFILKILVVVKIKANYEKPTKGGRQRVHHRLFGQPLPFLIRHPNRRSNRWVSYVKCCHSLHLSVART